MRFFDETGAGPADYRTDIFGGGSIASSDDLGSFFALVLGTAAERCFVMRSAPGFGASLEGLAAVWANDDWFRGIPFDLVDQGRDVMRNRAWQKEQTPCTLSSDRIAVKENSRGFQPTESNAPRTFRVAS